MNCRRLCWIIALLTAPQLVQAYLQHQNSGGETPTFQARSELVVIPVHVERKGKHAPGLRREQFSISDNAVAQEVAVFEEVRAKAGQVQKHAYPSGHFGTLDVSAVPMLTVIAFDAITTPKLQQTYFRHEVLKFLRQAADRNLPIGLVALNPGGAQIIADFTTDPELLRQAVRNLRTPSGGTIEPRGVLHEDLNGIQFSGADPAHSERMLRAFLEMRDAQDTIAVMQDRAARLNALDMLDQLAEALAGIPGRKALIWAGAGFPINPGFFRERQGNVAVDVSHTIGDYARQRETLQKLNAGKIAVYPVDTRGVTNPAFLDMDKKYASDAEAWLRHERDQQIVTMFRDVAMMTGGKPCVGTADMADCMRQTIDDAEQYYLVGFYHRKPPATGWHKVSVKVSGERVKVRAPSGYVVAAADPQRAERELALAWQSPLESSSLKFRGAWNGGKGAFGLQIGARELLLDAAGGNHLSFDVYVAGYDKTGKRTMLLSKRIDQRLNAEQLQQFQTAGIQYQNEVAVSPETVRVRFVVRDNLSGRIGTATTEPMK